MIFCNISISSICEYCIAFLSIVSQGSSTICTFRGTQALEPVEFTKSRSSNLHFVSFNLFLKIDWSNFFSIMWFNIYKCINFGLSPSCVYKLCHLCTSFFWCFVFLSTLRRLIKIKLYISYTIARHIGAEILFYVSNWILCIYIYLYDLFWF